MKVSSRAGAIAPSATMAMDTRTKALIASGQDIVNFTAGEPDFDTPVAIRQSGIAAIESGYTRYTAAAGAPEVKDAVRHRVQQELGLQVGRDEVLVSSGGKHALFNAIFCLVDAGDEVLIPSPYWVSYPEQVRLAGGIPRTVSLSEETGWKVTVAQLEAARSPRTRGLILNSPSNPTGAVLAPEDVAAIAEWAVRRDMWVISDEIYARLIYDGTEHRSIATFPEMRERTVIINGVSKAYAMTGWRIGYAVGPSAVIDAMSNLQSQTTSGANSIAQRAAAQALLGDDTEVLAMRQAFDERRQVAFDRMQRLPGLYTVKPQGAFYLWVNLTEWMGQRLGGGAVRSDEDFAMTLLEEAKVGVVPGVGFGMPGYFRMSYAQGIPRINEGMDRMEALLRRR